MELQHILLLHILYKNNKKNLTFEDFFWIVILSSKGQRGILLYIVITVQNLLHQHR